MEYGFNPYRNWNDFEKNSAEKTEHEVHYRVCSLLRLRPRGGALRQNAECPRTHRKKRLSLPHVEPIMNRFLRTDQEQFVLPGTNGGYV